MIDLQPCALRFAFDHKAERIPGFACGTGSSLRFGHEAAAQMRLYPQEVHTDIWEALSVAPMDPPLAGFRHLADLAIAQLREIDPPKEHQICLVPSWWEREQLGILLSVLGACGIKTRQLMRRSLALAATRNEEGKFWILEQGWHRVVLTRFRAGKTVKQVEQVELSHHGVLDCLRALARRVSERCLEEHRIDPLYSAESDQQLFDALRAWIGNPEGNLSLQVGRKQLDIPDVEGLLEQVMVPVYDWVRSVCGPRPCFTESTLARILQIPECHICPENTLMAGLLPKDESEEVGLIEELFPVSGMVEENGLPTTHLVLDGIAFPLDRTDSVRLPGQPPIAVPSGAPGESFRLADGTDVLRIHVP